MRDGLTSNTTPADGLRAGDIVMLVSSTADLPALDRLFAARKARPLSLEVGSVDFTLSADANAGEVADMYGFQVTPHERDLSLSAVMHARLGNDPPPPTKASTLLKMRVDEAVRSIRELFLTDPRN